MSRANQFSTPAQRIAWLVKHPEYLKGDEEDRDLQKRAVRAMQADGLFSPKTYWFDIRISALVRNARAVRELMEQAGIESKELTK